MEFWWVDALLVVFRRAKKIYPLLCPRNLAAESQLDSCGLRRVHLFSHTLLNSVELKAVSNLAKIHERQVESYLKSTGREARRNSSREHDGTACDGMECGLLVNFGNKSWWR